MQNFKQFLVEALSQNKSSAADSNAPTKGYVMSISIDKPLPKKMIDEENNEKIYTCEGVIEFADNYAKLPFEVVCMVQNDLMLVPNQRTGEYSKRPGYRIMDVRLKECADLDKVVEAYKPVFDNASKNRIILGIETYLYSRAAKSINDASAFHGKIGGVKKCSLKELHYYVVEGYWGEKDFIKYRKQLQSKTHQKAVEVNKKTVKDPVDDAKVTYNEAKLVGKTKINAQRDGKQLYVMHYECDVSVGRLKAKVKFDKVQHGFYSDGSPFAYTFGNGEVTSKDVLEKIQQQYFSDKSLEWVECGILTFVEAALMYKRSNSKSASRTVANLYYNNNVIEQNLKNRKYKTNTERTVKELESEA